MQVHVPHVHVHCVHDGHLGIHHCYSSVNYYYVYIRSHVGANWLEWSLHVHRFRLETAVCMLLAYSEFFPLWKVLYISCIILACVYMYMSLQKSHHQSLLYAHVLEHTCTCMYITCMQFMCLYMYYIIEMFVRSYTSINN